MKILNELQIQFVAGGAAAPAPAPTPAPCPSGGTCPIDDPQSEVGKTIDDVARGVVKLADEIVDVAKMLLKKL